MPLYFFKQPNEFDTFIEFLDDLYIKLTGADQYGEYAFNQSVEEMFTDQTDYVSYLISKGLASGQTPLQLLTTQLLSIQERYNVFGTANCKISNPNNLQQVLIFPLDFRCSCHCAFEETTTFIYVNLSNGKVRFSTIVFNDPSLLLIAVLGGRHNYYYNANSSVQLSITRNGMRTATANVGPTVGFDFLQSTSTGEVYYLDFSQLEQPTITANIAKLGARFSERRYVSR
mgnify:CR=1 FL=1